MGGGVSGRVSLSIDRKEESIFLAPWRLKLLVTELIARASGGDVNGKYFLLSIVLTLFWIRPQALAQTAPIDDAETLNDGETRGEEIPTECHSLLPSAVGGSCTFRCSAGDSLYVSGSGNRAALFPRTSILRWSYRLLYRCWAVHRRL